MFHRHPGASYDQPPDSNGGTFIYSSWAFSCALHLPVILIVLIVYFFLLDCAVSICVCFRLNLFLLFLLLLLAWQCPSAHTSSHSLGNKS